MKTYTTPTIKIQCEGAKDALSNALQVLVTLAGRKGRVTKQASIEGDVLTFTLTQTETATLGAGKLALEITCSFEDKSVIKSETLYTTLEQAVFQEVMHHA